MKKLFLSLPLLLSVFIAQAKEIKIWNGLMANALKIDLDNGKQSEAITESSFKSVNIPAIGGLVLTDNNNKKYKINLPAFNNEVLFLSSGDDASKLASAAFIVEYKGAVADDMTNIKAPADLKIPGGNAANPRTVMLNDGSGEKYYFVGNELKVEEIK